MATSVASTNKRSGCLFKVLTVVVVSLCLIVILLLRTNTMPDVFNRPSSTVTLNAPVPQSSSRPSSGSKDLPLSAPLPFDSMSWTSLRNGTDQDTKFHSAYYESREKAPHAPSVYVFGYHMKKLKKLKLYCHFVFDGGRAVCLKKPVKLVGSCSGGLDADKIAKSYTYVCKLECKTSTCSEDEIPVSVALSKSSSCDELSGLIPVRNRVIPQPINQKTFGVCVQSPVYGKSLNLQQISAFIEVNRAIGADVIYLYVMDMEEDLLKTLLEKYSKVGILQLIRWVKVKKWRPLHYFGQSLIMHDCLHRNMYKVKYLAFNDLDELLLPMKHKTWFELLDDIGNPDRYHSYRFGNCFYVNDNNAVPDISLPCDKVSISQYFKNTDRRKCYCGDKFTYRPKYMIRTEYVVDMFIHWVCQSVKGNEHKVSNSRGVNAHYRDKLPKDCSDKASVKDTTLMKYKSQVFSELGQRFCH